MPAWSWDSQYLAVVSTPGSQIHVLKAETWEEVAVTSGPGYHLSPRWHPDNRHVFYYISSGPDSLTGIWQFDITTGTSERTVVEHGTYPAVDASGQRLAYSALNELESPRLVLRMADLGTGTVKTLITFDPYDTGPEGANNPQFSSDGSRILFWSFGKGSQQVQGVWEFTLADSSLTHLVYGSFQPAFRPARPAEPERVVQSPG